MQRFVRGRDLRANTGRRKTLAVVALGALLLPLPALARGGQLETSPGSSLREARETSPLPREHARPLSGRAIADQVLAELKADAVIPMDNIGVVVVDGELTISGAVTSLDVKQRVERIAEGVRGVRSVRNNVRVRAEAPHTDRQLQQYVERSLRADPATRALEIEAEAKRGVITLIDKVPSLAEKQLAGDIAADIFAVREVKNRLVVATVAEPRNADEVRASILSALQWDARVDAADVTVRVVERTAFLEGSVSSAAERRHAVESAWVRGVTDVNATGLVVDPTRERGLSIARAEVSGDSAKRDEALTAAVRRTFSNHPRLQDAEVRVEVDASGAVTLYGVVDSVKAKRTATALVRGRLGVERVRNRLRVDPAHVVVSTAPAFAEVAERGAHGAGDAKDTITDREGALDKAEGAEAPAVEDPLSDDELAAEVLAALGRDAYLSSRRIAVDVVKGEVYLDGDVTSAFERMRADDATARVRGVTDIHNELDVESAPAAGSGGARFQDDDVTYVYEWFGS